MTALPETSGRNVQLHAVAYVPDENGEQREVASCDYWIWINSSYWKLELSYEGEMAEALPNLTPGESIGVSPSLLLCSEDAPSGAEAGDAVRYRWEWNADVVEITAADGTVLTEEQNSAEAPFTLKKLQNWNTDLWLVAELPDEKGNYYEAARQYITLSEINYEIWLRDLRGGDSSWIYSDEDEIFELNTDQLTGLNYTVDWSVDKYGEGGFTDVIQEGNGYTVGQDGDSILLDGGQLAGQLSEEEYGVFLHAVVKVQGMDASRTDVYVSFRDPSYDYRFPGWGPQLPGWSIGMDRTINCYVENREYPDGAEIETEITDVTVTVEEGEEDAVTCEAREDGSGWELFMNGFGHATVTMEYTLTDGSQSEEPYVTDIWVVDNFYQISFEPSTGVNQLLPGGTLDLTAKYMHYFYSEEDGYRYGSTEDVTLEWSCLTEDWAEVVSIEQDPDDQKILHVTGLENAAGREVLIRAAAYVPDENGELQEVSSYEDWLYVTDSYWKLNAAYEGETSEHMPNLAPGESVNVVPELLLYNEENPDGIRPDIQPERIRYRWEWDKNAVRITDADGKELTYEQPTGTAPFTLTKLENWNTWLTMGAELPEEDDNYGEVARIGLYLEGCMPDVVITKQPKDYIGTVGSRVTFTVEAEGEGLSYRWQLSDDDGATWRNSSTVSATYATTLTVTNNGRMVRCVITDANGNSVTSDGAYMRIIPIEILSQPEDYIGAIGSRVTFTVEASGENLSYRWQLSDNDGATWRNSSTVSATYATTLNVTNNGRMVRCVITDEAGNSVTSDGAYMRIAES